MIFKIHSITENGITIYARIDNDGICRLTCTEDCPEFKTWLELGNTPEPADE
jgi:hypothetical protein